MALAMAIMDGKVCLDDRMLDHLSSDGKFAFTEVIQFGQNYSDFPSNLGQYLYMFDANQE